MADATIRFRAGSRLAYAQALISLTELAREGTRDFSFGPLDLGALEDQGLTISGPDLEKWADDFMGSAPGLHRADE